MLCKCQEYLAVECVTALCREIAVGLPVFLSLSRVLSFAVLGTLIAVGLSVFLPLVCWAVLGCAGLGCAVLHMHVYYSMFAALPCPHHHHHHP